MAASWETVLHRWTTAGLIDVSSAERIREWERLHGTGSPPNRLAALTFGCGGLLLIAGIFLFVSSHWDAMPQGARFAAIVGMVSAFHIAGALSSSRSPMLAMTLHAAGTASLGAGIVLCGQIFNMAEQWPAALLLWAIGAITALILLKDWTHLLWVAVLVPAWLSSEWVHDIGFTASSWHDAPIVVGAVLLAFTYLSARIHEDGPTWRLALARLGATALIPASILLSIMPIFFQAGLRQENGGLLLPEIMSWLVFLALPFATAIVLRGKQSIYLIFPLLWCLAVIQFNNHLKPGDFALYGVYALGALGLAVWGVKEQRTVTINLGVRSFTLVLVAFYFSTVFDKLGRSLGLIGMGILFLGGGWFLERIRRRLISRIEESGQ